MRPFLPTPRETNVLVVLGCAALGYGLYLRYAVVESQSLEIACAAGLPRAVCHLRRIVIDLSEMEFFGGAALVAAVLHLVRPRVITFAVGLFAAILGLVLSNNVPSAFATALLVIGFARPERPAPANKPLPASAASGQTTTPASSRTSR
jgi:hypothetical protein